MLSSLFTFMHHRLLFVVFFCMLAGPARAQVQVDRLFPPAAAIGQSSSLKAEGKFPAWPATVVCDRTDITVSLGEESGSLHVEVAEDAAPGIAWLRFHDDSSASSLVPLLIESLPSTIESEPNAAIAQANAIELPAIVAGRLEKRGELDTYAVQLQAKQTVVVSAVANQWLASPMDAVLQIADGEGNVLAQADDDRGLDPQLVYTVEEPATVYVRIFAFPETPNSTIGYSGGSDYVYQLRMTTGPLLDHTLPLAAETSVDESRSVGWNLPEAKSPQWSSLHWSSLHWSSLPSGHAVSYLPGALGWHVHARAPVESAMILETGPDEPAATAATLPAVFSGTIGDAGQVDRFRFVVQKGKTYRARVVSRELGFPLDSVLRLVDPDKGNELARNDDAERNRYDAEMTYKADVQRQVELQVSDLVDGFGPGRAYSVIVDEVRSSVQLNVSEDHFTLAAGASVEIPVTIERRDGFDDRLQITAERLPEGVTATPAISEPKGDSAKTVTLKLAAAKEVRYQGEIRLFAQRVDAEGQASSPSYPVHYRLRQQISIDRVWLTVAAAK